MKSFVQTYLRTFVAQEINAALSHFKSLKPIMDKYGKTYSMCAQNSVDSDHNVVMFTLSFNCAVYNDGTTKDLMCLSGTISVMYNGNNSIQKKQQKQNRNMSQSATKC